MLSNHQNVDMDTSNTISSSLANSQDYTRDSQGDNFHNSLSHRQLSLFIQDSFDSADSTASATDQDNLNFDKASPNNDQDNPPSKNSRKINDSTTIEESPTLEIDDDDIAKDDSQEAMVVNYPSLMEDQNEEKSPSTNKHTQLPSSPGEDESPTSNFVTLIKETKGDTQILDSALNTLKTVLRSNNIKLLNKKNRILPPEDGRMNLDAIENELEAGSQVQITQQTTSLLRGLIRKHLTPEKQHRNSTSAVTSSNNNNTQLTHLVINAKK